MSRQLQWVCSHPEKILWWLIKKDINLFTKLDSYLGWVKTDLDQIEQMVMNLPVNARDAISKVGR